MNLEVKIAIASGKGGTGKTTVAANLAWTIADLGCKVQYIDCDVEEPNGHLFLKPTFASSESVGILVPVVDEALCNSCRRCAEVCEFHAIAVFPNFATAAAAAQLHAQQARSGKFRVPLEPWKPARQTTSLLFMAASTSASPWRRP